MILPMLPLRPLLLLGALTVLLFEAVHYLSQNVLDPVALTIHVQPLLLAAIICVPLSYLGAKLKQI